MAVLMLFEVPGATLDQYEQLNEIMGIHGHDDAPDGLVEHVAGHDGDALVIVDVWQSQEALDRFFQERLGAAIEQAGIDAGAPRVLPLHNMLHGAGSDAGVIMLVELDGVGPDAYDEMISTMDAHIGDGTKHPAVSHSAARTESGMLVADLWESPEAFGKFAEAQVAPAGAAVGLGPIEPRFVAVHNRIRGRAPQPA